LRKWRADGTIAPQEDVVIVLTGHVLKDTSYIAQYHASNASFANRIVDAPDDEALQMLIDKLAAVHVVR
jgi:threonine synthase